MLDHSQKRLVEDLLRRVGDNCIYPYFRNLSEGDVSFKESKLDPVSVADKEAERLLMEGLVSLLPDSFFVGEESYAENVGILKSLQQNEQPVWVVDPIDGTANFVAGREGFGIMVSLVLAGETISSWLYEVCSKTLTVLHTGGDITINGQAVAPARELLEPYRGQIGFKLYQFPEVQALKQETEKLQINPAEDPSIIHYPRILSGEVDFLVYRVTYPWDHVPGVALVCQNGGVACRWSGEAFQVSDMYEGLVVARSAKVLDVVMAEIIEPLAGVQAIMEMRSFKR